MVLVVFIVLTILIGAVVPQVLVPRLPARHAVLIASVVTLALGAGAVWVGAQIFGALGVEEAGSAFDRGFNAWKLMLLIAPGSAIHANKNRKEAAQ
ncbi:MAG: hypothetical protein AAF557_05700 [Pseudomonadota bacterium]